MEHNIRKFFLSDLLSYFLLFHPPTDHCDKNIGAILQQQSGFNELR